MINRDLCYHNKYKRNIFLDICCMFTFNCVFKKKNELFCVLCVYEYSTVKHQCWALAPLLAPPRHWWKLKKVAHVAVALK